MEGADVFFGLSTKGAVSQAMVKSMAERPMVAAMANPDPEIAPEDVRAVRPDAIMCTGRSDYPNQINNVLGFPYIFRGALDVRASTINDAMKIAAARALAKLAREDVPDEVAAAYAGQRLRYGPDYIVPTPFDPRLISTVPPAVAKAAVESGVARKPPSDFATYRSSLMGRLDPTAASLQRIFDQVRANPRRVVFAEGEEEKTIRAALSFRDNGYGTPVLIARHERITETLRDMGLDTRTSFEIHNPRLAPNKDRYIAFLYERLQRTGALHRDCERLVNQDRNVFAACMVACGDADALVTGETRNYFTAFEDVARVIGPRPGRLIFGFALLLSRGRSILIADTTAHARPSAAELADIAMQSAERARHMMGQEPRVALLSHSNFGNPGREQARRIKEAVALLDERRPDFEYDGEMSAEVALNYALMRDRYPFSRLTGAANVLIMPGLDSANLAAQLLEQMGGGKRVGPLLMGLDKPAQILEMGSTVSDFVNLAALAAHEAILGGSP
jgi:malate dehydrogenase (oxaloacetate-decarboxylating)(NADP+)